MLDMWKEKKSQWMKHGFYVSPIKTKKNFCLPLPRRCEASLDRLFENLRLTRQPSIDPPRDNLRFSFDRQSNLHPIHRSPGQHGDELTI
jgi:hypothetical protein